MGRNRPKHHNALIVCTPGLEEVVLDELADLGVKTMVRDGKGAVIATLSTRELYAANALLRSATRILVRAFSFRAETFAGLESEIQRLDWSPYVSDQPLNSVVSSHASALYHTKAIQERLQRWVPSGPPNDDAALRIVVRAVDDIFTVRIDTSGDELYRRGWRPESAKMGLRESVAAAVVRRSGWDQASPLLDPCCGSGTVAIEAALQAAGARRTTCSAAGLRSSSGRALTSERGTPSRTTWRPRRRRRARRRRRRRSSSRATATPARCARARTRGAPASRIGSSSARSP